MTDMPILSHEVRAAAGDLQSLRREFHQHPELAYKETRTAQRVAAFLEGTAGLGLRTGLGGTGIVAAERRLGPHRPSPRGHGRPCRSRSRATRPMPRAEPGVMHACGHDGHTAIGARGPRPRRVAPPPGPRPRPVPARRGRGGRRAGGGGGRRHGRRRPGPGHPPLERAARRNPRREGGPLDGGGGPRADRDPRPRRPRRQAPPLADPVVAAAHVVDGAADHRLPRSLATAVGGRHHRRHPRRRSLQRDPRRGHPRPAPSAPSTWSCARSMPERITPHLLGRRRRLRMPRRGQPSPATPPSSIDPGMAEMARRAAERSRRRGRRRDTGAHHGRRGHGRLLRARARLLRLRRLREPGQGLIQPHHSPSFDFDEDALAIGCEFLLQAAQEALRPPT